MLSAHNEFALCANKQKKTKKKKIRLEISLLPSASCIKIRRILQEYRELLGILGRIRLLPFDGGDAGLLRGLLPLLTLSPSALTLVLKLVAAAGEF
jgi:hypothetical protein